MLFFKFFTENSGINAKNSVKITKNSEKLSKKLILNNFFIIIYFFFVKLPELPAARIKEKKKLLKTLTK
jgi:hypothetical protein